MIATETQNFKLGPRDQSREFSLEVSPDHLFMPNAVTKLFSKSVKINPGDIVFDIGSGTGPLAIWAGLEPSSEVHAVEIVESQYNLLRRNIERNSLSHKVHAFHGSFFEPIPLGIKANVVVLDVSGIAEGPARALGWYPPSVPTGGDAGTEVIVTALKQTPLYLTEGARTYFPVATDLSNSEKTMEIARSRFRNLEQVTEHDFPLNDSQVIAMQPFLDIPYIRLRTKGTRKTWRGEIYVATDPIL